VVMTMMTTTTISEVSGACPQGDADGKLSQHHWRVGPGTVVSEVLYGAHQV
jgi:hypothetical protein